MPSGFLATPMAVPVAGARLQLLVAHPSCFSKQAVHLPVPPRPLGAVGTVAGLAAINVPSCWSNLSLESNLAVHRPRGRFEKVGTVDTVGREGRGRFETVPSRCVYPRILVTSTDPTVSTTGNPVNRAPALPLSMR